MLDLDAPTRRIALSDGATLDLAMDADDPLTFYVPPGAPRVARAGGAPRIQLYRFIRDGKLERGHLDLQVELGGPGADALQQARAQLQAERTGDHRPVRVVPLPVTAGEAELSFVGAEPTADGGKTAPHARVYATVTPGLDSPFTTTFSVPLDPAQTSLVEAAMRSGAAPIGVTVRLSVEGLLPAQRIVAHVDWRTVYRILSSDIKQGYLIATDDVQRLAQQLIQQQVIRISVIQAVVPDPAAPPPPDTAAQLAWIEKEIVETCCRPVMPLDLDPAHASLGTWGEMFGIGESYVLKDITEIERDTADIDLQTRRVAVRTLVASAHLADLLGDAAADAHITDGGTDLAFFARAGLHVTTARPLAATFVSDLVAHFHYGQTELPIHLAQGGAAEGTVETWADQQPDATWSLPIDVTFANDAPVDPGKQVSIPALTGKARELTLDLEQLLGIYSVDVLGSPDPRVAAARVDFTVLRAGAAVGSPAGATVTPAAPRATAWFRDVRAGDHIQAALTYLLAGGRILQVPPIAVETRALRLPPAFPGTMTVQLFADTDWTGLDRVTVSLQKSPTAPTGTVVLASAGASTSVSLDLPDPVDRTYRYRCARRLTNGNVEEDDWLTTDRSVLLVGRVAANMLVVDVTPQGLELPDAGINLIEVDLEYVDARNQVRSTPTAEIHALADVYHWTVALKDPSLRSYRYRITVHRVTGATQVGPWTTSADRILLVPVSKT
jgi:hypothetical protein